MTQPDSRQGDLEIGVHRRDAYRYSVELRFIPPDGETVDLTSGEIRVDWAHLRSHAYEDAQYGRELTETLFEPEPVRRQFISACRVAEARGQPIRLRLFVGPTAPELHTLRWERLVGLESGAPLLTRHYVHFSRYLASSDWRPARLRSRSRLKVVVAIADPANLADYNLDPIDPRLRLDTEAARLDDDDIVWLTDGAATLDRIVNEMRKGLDVLYLVCHGRLVPKSGASVLYLENDAREVAPVDGDRFARRLEQLERGPRLVVLVSCESGGSVVDQEDGVVKGELTALGPRLAEAGVPAVVAMHGQLSMATATRFLPTLLRELQQDGRVDRAMAVARSSVQDGDDWWRPVLFMRLRSGRLWYTRGLSGPKGRGLDKWASLVSAVEAEKCTPILGPGLTEYLLGNRREVAERWASTEQFPMSPGDRRNLPRVAQYLSTRQDDYYPRHKLTKYLRREMLERYRSVLEEQVRSHLVEGGTSGAELEERLESALLKLPLEEQINIVGRRRMEADPKEPHRFLASLGLPIFVTTNYSDLMAVALRLEGRSPRVEAYRWREEAEESESPTSEGSASWRPSVNEPLVYHLFGRFARPESIVLTEDDYFDYLIGLDKRKNRLRSVVGRALVNTSLLFLGFRMEDWGSRVLFRSIITREGSRLRHQHSHVSVQLDPEVDHIIEPLHARDYLKRYFENADISLYLGSVQDFIDEFEERLGAV